MRRIKAKTKKYKMKTVYFAMCFIFNITAIFPESIKFDAKYGVYGY